MVSEMKKLRELLNNASIKWHDESEKSRNVFFMDRTHFWYRNYKWSVINGYGSYGGYDPFSNTNHGHLELMSNAINGGEPVEIETAEEAFKIIIGD